MVQHFYAGAHGQQVNAVTCLISNQPLAVVWLRVHKEEARLLREVICGAREVVKSVPVGFAFSVEHHCSCFSLFFSYVFLFGSHYLGELLDSENKALAVRNSCNNFCIATDLNLFWTF